jgi:hypothetical protein
LLEINNKTIEVDSSITFNDIDIKKITRDHYFNIKQIIKNNTYEIYLSNGQVVNVVNELANKESLEITIDELFAIFYSKEVFDIDKFVIVRKEKEENEKNKIK